MPPQYKHTSFKLDILKLVPKSVCVRQISTFFQKIYVNIKLRQLLTK